MDGMFSNFLRAEHFYGITESLNRLGAATKFGRFDLVIQHWTLLSNANFMASSGKGYAGVGMPAQPTLKNRCIRQFAKFNALLTPSIKT